MQTLHIHLLGGFRLLYDNEPLPLAYQVRQQSLLAYLLLHRNTPLSRQHLAFLFWPESGETQAFNNLRKAIHLLRTSLLDAENLLAIDARTVQWRANVPVLLDVDQFEQHLAAADQCEQNNDHADVRTHLDAAVAQYAGDLLPDCYDEWVVPERERLHERYIETLSRLSSLLEQDRDYPAAIRQTNRLLRTDPLHEESYRRLMRLHALQGDRAAALRAYHTCATLLLQELGVDPSPLTQAAYAQILRLEMPSSTAIAMPPSTRPHDSLVGRKHEWQQLLSVWQHVTGGHTHSVVISGEAGIGKTRLAEEMLRWTSHQGITTVRTRAYAGDSGLAYAPVLELLRSEPLYRRWLQLEPIWLGELARLVPEMLSLPSVAAHPDSLGERWQRQRLFEALSRAILSASMPLLLLIDDLQWCDPETIAWLHHLLRFNAKAQLLIIGTARTEEIDADHPLLSLLLTLRSASLLTEVALLPLDPVHTAELANHVAEQHLAPAMLEQLIRTSEGNPLFVTEIVRTALSSPSDSAQNAEANAFVPIELPAKVQAVIQQRLARLSTGARELVSVAAVIGRSFTVPVLVEASGLQEDALVQALDELWQRRIVREQGADAYDFTHDRIRESAYAAISLARRRLLHRRVADALEQTQIRVTASAAQMAFHYEQAGLIKQAVAHYAQAAKAAHQVYAFSEAVGYLTKALDLLQMQPASSERNEQEVDLLSALGAAWSAVKTWAAAEAQHAYDRAFALSRNLAESPRLFTALWGLHEFHLFRSEYERALETATACLRIAEGLQDPALCLEAHHAMWGVLLFSNQYVFAIEHANQGVALYNRHLHQSLAFQFGNHDAGHCGLSIAGIGLWMGGFPDQARAYLQRAIELVQELSLSLSQAEAYYNHAHIWQLLGDPSEVRKWADSTVNLAREHGLQYCQAIGLALAGWARSQQGEHHAGLDLLQQGMAIWEREGMHCMQTYLTVLQAEAYVAASEVDAALKCVVEGQSFAIEFGEHFFEPELYRLQGDLLAQQGAPSHQVESCYQQALALARQQGAKMLELRVAIALAQQWLQQGKRNEANDLLAGIFAWFTEGFATSELQEAQLLLEALTTG